MNSRLTAALLAVLSVGCFAGIGLFQQRLTSYFSVVTILAFRALAGAFFLGLYVAIFERVTSGTVFRSLLFYAWAAVFACTILLYGFAFSGRSLADVYLISALMPIFVIMIEWYLNRANFRRILLLPIGVMFICAIIPHGYKVWSGHASLVLSWASFFALLGAACHAVWFVMGRLVARDTQPSSDANRAMYMCLVGAVPLLIASNTDAAFVVEATIRNHFSQPRYFLFAHGWDHMNLLCAALLSAMAVLLAIRAVGFDDPANVAPYQYTIAIWGTALTILFARGAPDNTIDVLGVMIVSSLAIAAGAVWLNVWRQRYG